MLYPWQIDDWRRLNVERERLPNAWMLTGLTGIGKLAFAEHLAQSLLCDAPGADYAPCGQCEACRWFALGSHPDFRRLTPLMDDDDGKEKISRKLPVIKIEAVRELIEYAHLSSHRNGQRVVLIEPAEALNPAAANALLKILEEPPADVLFLLVAHAPQRLLPTIKSRCRQYALSAPAPAVALAWLRDHGVAHPETELAHHGGAPLFDHDPVLSAARDAFIEGLITPSLAGVLTLAERVDKLKLPLAVPLEWLQMWLHDLAALRLAGSLRYYPDHQAALEALARRANPQQLMQCQQTLLKLAPFGYHTLNVRLQLEALLMDYLKVFA
jgi:DNA polymerase-3 subunit delta'